MEYIGVVSVVSLYDCVYYCDMIVSIIVIHNSYLCSALIRHTPYDKAGYDCAPPHWKKLALVCTHGSRDKRCGRAGPIVIAELNRLLAEQVGVCTIKPIPIYPYKTQL
jgi:hypothetical protein